MAGDGDPTPNAGRHRSTDWLLWGKRICLALLVLAVISSLWTPIAEDNGYLNIHVLTAKAFLSGHADLDVVQGGPVKPADVMDVAHFRGRTYSSYAPGPAIVLAPFVAVLGPKWTKGTIVSLLLTIIGVFALWRILLRLGIDASKIPWIAGALFLGTGYWYCVIRSATACFFAQVVATTFLLLAVVSGLGGRGLVCGVFAGMAFLSRQVTLFAAIPLLAILWGDAERNSVRIRRIALFVGACAVIGGSYLLYNHVRFGSYFDTGYAYVDFVSPLKDRLQKFGLWSIAYVPSNLAYMFLQGFHMSFVPPRHVAWPRMDLWGTSLTFASPFVFVALFARERARIRWAIWVYVAITISVLMFWFDNGWVQVNTQRYTLDFLPMLILVVALGTKRVQDKIWKAAVAYSIALNAIAYFVPHWVQNLHSHLL